MGFQYILFAFCPKISIYGTFEVWTSIRSYRCCNTFQMHIKYLRFLFLLALTRGSPDSDSKEKHSLGSPSTSGGESSSQQDQTESPGAMYTKLHQRTLLKTTIQEAELGYEETAKSIAPGVDQAKLLVPTLLFSIPRIRKSPNCSLSASGSTRWDSPQKHLQIRTSPSLDIRAWPGLGSLGVPEADEKI